MRNVLIIAGREISRLKARFSGKMVTAVAVLLIAAAAVSFLVYQQSMVLARDFYIVGVSPTAPQMNDGRFDVQAIPTSGAGLALKEKRIDAYVTGTTIFGRDDDRSRYAAGAAKTYLDKGELTRIAEAFPLNKAFPLRVEISHLRVAAKDAGPEPGATGAEAANLSPGVASAMASPSVSAASDVKGQASPPASASAEATTDAEVRKQLESLQSSRVMPEFKAEFASDTQVIVPSLMNPPIPLAQVLLAFAYILPIFFISIFFTSGFIEEKMGRKINILLSAPVTPLQVILGKMLPYLVYSVLVVIAITLVLRGNILLALAIFVPVILFIFAIYLGVALQYRTFRDQTFFSLVAVTAITGYLVFPAMFVGINDLSYISPLTLAVQMYRGMEITLPQYMLSAVPMLLVFTLGLTVATRVFNEEYLMSFRPIHVKIRDAIFLAMDKRRLAVSVAAFAIFLIPVVFMFELGVITMAFNLPKALALGVVVFICVVIEEAAKSITVATAVERGLVRGWPRVLTLAVVSAFFFFLGEKLLLFMSLKVISESIFTTAIFASNVLWLPLLVHCACTLVVCALTYRFGMRSYPMALLCGSILHGLYNMYLIGAVK